MYVVMFNFILVLWFHQGQLFDQDGQEIYNGDFVSGKENGRCRKVYPTGVYEGNIVDSKREVI